MSENVIPRAKQQNNSYAGSTYVQWGSDYLSDIWPSTQTFLIPNITLSHPEIGGRAGARIKRQADSVTFAPLVVDLLLDREFELYNIMYTNYINRLNVLNSQYSEHPFDLWCSIIGADGEEICKWNFYNCRVEDISEIAVDTMSEDDPLVCTLTIGFDYLDYALSPK